MGEKKGAVTKGEKISGDGLEVSAGLTPLHRVL